MCLAIPMRLIEINGSFGVCSISSVKRNVDLSLIEEPKIGDFLIVHAGFAINKLDENEARETLELLNIEN